MKAFLEVVKFNAEDVVTASGTLCAGEAPCIQGACEDPDIDL